MPHPAARMRLGSLGRVMLVPPESIIQVIVSAGTASRVRAVRSIRVDGERLKASESMGARWIGVVLLLLLLLLSRLSFC